MSADRGSVAAVVVTRIPIPRPKQGSWTQMFEALFAAGGHGIEYLICPPVAAGDRLPTVEYVPAFDTSVPVLRRYLPHSRFAYFYHRLKQLTAKHERLVVLIVDDYNLLFGVQEWLTRSGLRSRIAIVFFIHGMSYFFDTPHATTFYRSIDEIVFLTHASYALERARTLEMPCEVSVVWNGIDKTRFRPVDRATKGELRRAVGLPPEGIVFLWLARDQRKKGLHIVLRAWEEFAPRHPEVQLAVVGAPARESIERVTFFGSVPYRDVAPYVQMCDVYLFPTLWSEGFGLSVVEALSAGLLTLASDIGPMREVLGDGRYGRLIAEPHVVGHWLAAMEHELGRFVQNDFRSPYQPLEAERYSIEGWRDHIGRLVAKWKTRVGSLQPV